MFKKSIGDSSATEGTGSNFLVAGMHEMHGLLINLKITKQ